MEISAAKASSADDDCVRVAVNIRPLITSELLMGCTDCITVVPGESQVQIGSHVFTYDSVYGSLGSPSSDIYEECVAPLIDSLFQGYNATVLAYGQTGSGKTYTMGTNYTDDIDDGRGIIPQVMDSIFEKVEAMKDDRQFVIRVSFIEIFKEEVFDLLDSNSLPGKSPGTPTNKPGVPARFPIQIRETANGGIALAGVTEAEVYSKEDMASFLARGSLSRATASTNMNTQSSRSHAIFIITMDLKKKVHFSNNGEASFDDGDTLSAKLHLVDLAGSERAKRTGADEMRFKEGIHINKGLLALGNVISVLGDEKKRKEGGHVPYRDSKLTRLLQDSLGGNSKTVMIACVSPADTNAEETINTLKYANRARNIQNKAVINQDAAISQMQKMRSQLQILQAELLHFRGGGTPLDELQFLKDRISLLEATNAKLCQEVTASQITCDYLAKCALDAQIKKDELILKLEGSQNDISCNEINNASGMQEFNLLKMYASKIQDLEVELLRLKNLCSYDQSDVTESFSVEDDELKTENVFLQIIDENLSQCEGEVQEGEKEREHSSLQDKFGKELQDLDNRLQQKEEEIKEYLNVDTSTLKQLYEKKLFELEQEKIALQKEIEDLSFKLANLSSTFDDGSLLLKEEYTKKLNALEAQVSELKKKQDAQSKSLRQKQKSDEKAIQLQEEIQKIKTQKVQLQQKMKQESERFRLWRASREKEVLQLKKEGRRNEYEMHKLLALNQRQKMVLQRKTEEAALATKRLKELLQAKKTIRELSADGDASKSGLQVMMQAIENELELMVRVHEVRSEYERQLKERAVMANEITKLKEQPEMAAKNTLSDYDLRMSPSARNSRILALENMLAISSSTLVSMASELSEAEERVRAFSSRNRWNPVQSLSEAKKLLNNLFKLASSSRCKLQDKELACSEMDLVIRELKEKVVSLSSVVKQLEAQKLEVSRRFKPFNCIVNDTDLLEDKDTSESDEELPDYLQSGISYKEADCSEHDIWSAGSKPSIFKTRKNEFTIANTESREPSSSVASKYVNAKVWNVRADSQEILNAGMTRQCICGRTLNLASYGAMLLQHALSSKTSTVDKDVSLRKPLSIISNSILNVNRTMSNRIKKQPMEAIQLVPVTTPLATSGAIINDHDDYKNQSEKVDVFSELIMALELLPDLDSNVLRKSNPELKNDDD